MGCTLSVRLRKTRAGHATAGVIARQILSGLTGFSQDCTSFTRMYRSYRAIRTIISNTNSAKSKRARPKQARPPGPSATHAPSSTSSFTLLHHAPSAIRHNHHAPNIPTYTGGAHIHSVDHYRLTRCVTGSLVGGTKLVFGR